MASPPVLNSEPLLAPIPGDNPAGGAIPFEIREKLEEGRKEINLEDFDKNDPARPTEAKKADWSGIIRLAQETLSKTSKDLLISARLTEALVKQHGFAGLRDGLHLMRLLVEQQQATVIDEDTLLAVEGRQRAIHEAQMEFHLPAAFQ